MCTVEESSEGNSNNSCQNMIGSGSESHDYNKLWDEARCPVCLDHPHNAVLLWCSSRDKGCRPFMCNTSTRHSNCLDQFRQSTEPSLSNQSNGSWDALICPLCRGQIKGWSVDVDAREYMNLKTRSCSNENCEFSGNYMELRKHARAEHPNSRPAVVDPARQVEWERLENEMALSSLLSASMNLPDFGGTGEGELIPPVDVSYEEAVMIMDINPVSDSRSNLNGAMVDDVFCLDSSFFENMGMEPLNQFELDNFFEIVGHTPNRDDNSRQWMFDSRIWDYRRGRSYNRASNNFISRRDSNRERFHRNSRYRVSSRRNGGVNNLNPRHNNGLRGNNTQRMRESRFNSSATYYSSRSGSHRRGNRNGR